MLKLMMAGLMLASATAGATDAKTQAKIDYLADEIAKLKKSQGSQSSKLSFGGYGELVYEKNEEGEEKPSDTTAEYDNLRFILYVGYEFSPKWKLVSEIEVEHADEIYMEQAYLEYNIAKDMYVRTGTLLLPVGIQNLYHEPTTFLGTDRTRTETSIIPSTWRENGIGLYGFALDKKLEYHVYYTTALTGKSESGKIISDGGIRNGRQKASNANAHKGAFTLAADYHLMSNFTVGGSVYRSELNGVTSDVEHNILELHYKGQFGAIHTRGLIAEATLDGVEDLNTELSTNAAEKMFGYYVELGYDVLYGKSDWQVIPFFRHEVIDTNDKVAKNQTHNKEVAQTHQTFGVVAKPMENITLKADYTKTTNEAENGFDSWNLGVGWNF